MSGLLGLLGASLIVLAVATYSFREAKRERRETLRMMQHAEASAALERAKLIEQVNGLLDRMSALIGRPWSLPPAAAPPDYPRVEESNLEPIAEHGELLDDVMVP